MTRCVVVEVLAVVEGCVSEVVAGGDVAVTVMNHHMFVYFLM